MIYNHTALLFKYAADFADLVRDRLALTIPLSLSQRILKVFTSNIHDDLVANCENSTKESAVDVSACLP